MLTVIGQEYSSRSGEIAHNDIDSGDEIAVIHTLGYGVLAMSFLVGVANLSDFVIEGRVSADGDWFELAGSGSAFTTPNEPILGASGDLTGAAFGSTVHWFKMDVLALESVRISASGTSSTLNGHFGLV